MLDMVRKGGARRPFIPEQSDRLLAERMRVQRDALGLSLDQVATKVGLGKTSLHRYETLQRGISAQHLRKLEQLLGPLSQPQLSGSTSGGSLASDLPATTPPSDEEGIVVTDADEQEVVALFRAMGDREKLLELGRWRTLAANPSVPDAASLDRARRQG